MPNGTLLTTKTLAGAEVEVYVSTTGYFEVCLPTGEQLSRNNNLDNAETQAKAQISKRKVKVAVPFITPEGKPGVGVGFHAANANLLVRIDGGKSRQDGRKPARWGSTFYFKADMPPNVLQDRKNQEVNIKTAQQRISAIDKAWALDLHKAVNDAIDEKLEKNA